MTNKDFLKMVDQVLTEICGCTADVNGDRPCDKGIKCGVCNACRPLINEAIWQSIEEDAMKRG